MKPGDLALFNPTGRLNAELIKSKIPNGAEVRIIAVRPRKTMGGNIYDFEVLADHSVYHGFGFEWFEAVVIEEDF